MWVGWFCSTFQQSPWVSSPGAHWEINFQPGCVHVMTHCSRLQTTTKTELKGTVHLPSSSSFLLSLSLWLSLAEDAERDVMKDMEGDKGRLYWSDSVLKLEVVHMISLVWFELDIFVLSLFLSSYTFSSHWFHFLKLLSEVWHCWFWPSWSLRKGRVPLNSQFYSGSSSSDITWLVKLLV